MKSNYLPAGFSDWLLLIIRLIIGGFFIYASIDKILNPNEFAKIIHNYRLLPPDFINLLAIILPWIEITAGVCLIIGFKYKGANFIILIMLFVFIFALAVNMFRGVNISCGCFSTSSTAKSNLLMRIIEDGLMVLGCFIIIFKQRIFKQFVKQST
ncbi:MAG: DoxX family membrane protein [candidate division Zixibacteria bacterium]|nr:DoxX family membrane protein [candidate division Zixibacteria bacterium]